jgi:hypothetical protein
MIQNGRNYRTAKQAERTIPSARGILNLQTRFDDQLTHNPSQFSRNWHAQTGEAMEHERFNQRSWANVNLELLHIEPLYVRID